MSRERGLHGLGGLQRLTVCRERESGLTRWFTECAEKGKWTDSVVYRD